MDSLDGDESVRGVEVQSHKMFPVHASKVISNNLCCILRCVDGLGGNGETCVVDEHHPVEGRFADEFRFSHCAAPYVSL